MPAVRRRDHGIAGVINEAVHIPLVLLEVFALLWKAPFFLRQPATA